jgi:hypothetical protein
MFTTLIWIVFQNKNLNGIPLLTAKIFRNISVWLSLWLYWWFESIKKLIGQLLVYHHWYYACVCLIFMRSYQEKTSILILTFIFLSQTTGIFTCAFALCSSPQTTLSIRIIMVDGAVMNQLVNKICISLSLPLSVHTAPLLISAHGIVLYFWNCWILGSGSVFTYSS